MKLGTTQKPARLTRENLLQCILSAQKILDEQRVPKTGHKLAYWDGTKVVMVKLK
jgi:hypothetical protein